MIIKPENNNYKILVALTKANKSLSVKILAENAGIPYKNIHRNLKQLFDNDFISKRISQEGRNRYTYISLTSKGSDFESNMTIEAPKKLIGNRLTSAIKEYDEGYNQALKEMDLECYAIPEVEPDTIRLGIGFYRDYARGLGIPNYSSLRLPMLKLKIGLALIKQSELVNTMTKINKYFEVDKF